LWWRAQTLASQELDISKAELEMAGTQLEKLYKVLRRNTLEDVVEKREMLRLSSEVLVDFVDGIEAGSQISSDERLASLVNEREIIGSLLKCVLPDHLSYLHWHFHNHVLFFFNHLHCTIYC
jgi:hypothetical protein